MGLVVEEEEEEEEEKVEMLSALSLGPPLGLRGGA